MGVLPHYTLHDLRRSAAEGVRDQADVIEVFPGPRLAMSAIWVSRLMSLLRRC
jgi:hypothetical protein